MTTSCFVNGDQSGTQDALVGVWYDVNVKNQQQQYLAQVNQVGSIWGLAYKKDTQQLFTSAVARRHTGLGSLGLGGIYVVANPDGASPSGASFVDLDGAPFNINFGTLGTNAARGLPANINTANNDATAFNAVGTQGIGDIDLSVDENTLWAVNLQNRSLLEIDVTGGNAPTSAGQVNEYLFSNMNEPSCTSGVLRPWGLKIKGDTGYVGAVCSAESDSNASNNSNLRGYVFSFDTTNPTTLTTELSFPLTTHGASNATISGPIVSRWNPWRTSFNVGEFGRDGVTISRPTPIISDIDFVGDDMVIGIVDRAGLQMGDQNYPPSGTSMYRYQSAGDILRACYVSGSYALESVGVCDGATGFSTNNGHGPGGGEFFDDSGFHYQNPSDRNGGAGAHKELSLGSIAVVPSSLSSGEIVVTVFDPVGWVNGQGLRWLSESDGSNTMSTLADGSSFPKNYNIVGGSPDGVANVAGKAVGLGDLEAICHAAPIEIGNRVWEDVNGNGIQDPGEPGLVGVQVQLLDNGGNVATTTTDADGHYIFSTASSTNTASAIYGLSLTHGVSYTLKAPAITTIVSDTFNLTAQDNDSTPDGDMRDSDGNQTTGEVTFKLGSAGQNNHTFDFGYMSGVSIGSTVFYDLNNNGLQDVGDDGIPGVTVTLYESDGTTKIMTDTTDVDGNYFFEGLEEGDYIVGVEAPADAPTSSQDDSQAGGDDKTDGDDNGLQTNPGDEAKSVSIELKAGDEPVNGSNNGEETGQGDIQDDAADDAGDMTIDFGFVPGVSIGSTVFYDMNDNGEQDAGEAGIPGVVVTLYESDGTTVVYSMTTNISGTYFFGGLAPDGYIVGVMPPADAPLSSTGAGGDDETDGDDNGIQANPGDEAKSSVITLAHNDEPTGESEQDGDQDSAYDSFGDMTVDFGFVPKVSVGSTVFYDQNDDGQQNGGDWGIEGVTVKLYAGVDADSDNIPDGAAIVTTTTDADGDYYFGNLLEGQYIVGVEAPANAPHSSTDIATSSADNQTDSDDNGIQASPGDEAFSPIIELKVNDEPEDANEAGQGGLQDNDDPTVDDNNGDMTVDFGFVAYDFGDLPDGNASGSPSYKTLEASSGPSHIIAPGLYMGSVVDPEFDGQPSATAEGDDSAGTPIDEDGVTFPAFYAGKSADVDVTATNTGTTDATLYGFIDFNGNGNFGDTGETASVTVPANSNGAVTLNFTTPALADTEQLLGARFRLSTDVAAASADGPASDGEVEDYLIPVFGEEYGDLPDIYGTIISGTVSMPAVHIVTDTLSLGSVIDSDGDGQLGADSGVSASGDDTADNRDDEDGITFLTPIMAGQPVEIQVVAIREGDATVGAWLDLDGDGTFNGTGEFHTLALTNGSGMVTDTISFVAPATISDTIYSRFRIAYDAAEVDEVAESVGSAATGEVEDYVLMSLGNQVWLDDGAGGGTANDGIFDAGEAGMANVAVELRDSNGVVMATTTTDGSGKYLFTGLISDTYVVHLPASNFGAGQPLENLASTTDTTVGNVDPDNDADEDTDENGIDDAMPATNGISSQPITLAYDSEPDVAVDTNGTNSNLTVDFGFIYYDLALIVTRSTGQDYTIDFSNSPLVASFDVVVENQGPVTVVAAKVIDTIPAGASLVSVDGTAMTPVTGTHTLNISNLAPGSSITFTLSMEVTDLSYGIYSNVAEVCSIEDGNGLEVPDIDSTGDITTTNDLINTSAGIDPNSDDDDNSHNDLAFGGTDDSAPGAIIESATSGDEDDHDQEVVVGGMALGNRVWYDPNNNGIIDGTEQGIENVLVEVYAVDGAGNPAGAAVGTDTTDANGYWLVDNLPPGNYIATIPASNFASNTDPLWTLISSSDIASSGNPNNDTESDDNGMGVVPNADIRSRIVTLDAGAGEPEQGSGEGDNGSGHGNAGDSFDNLTLDFGFTPPMRLGSTLFYDKNDNGLQDTGEGGIPAIPVELLDSTGAVIATTTTDANGDYLFEQIGPGDYQVRVPTPPTDAPMSSTTTDSADNQEDGDDNGEQPGGFGTPATSPAITLAADTEPAGETEQGGTQDATDDDNGDMTVDFGFVPPLSLGSTLFSDDDNNGLQENGEAGIAGITVELHDPISNTVVATTTTDANGDYLFEELLPGDYQVVIPTPPTDAPTSSTPTNVNDDNVDGDDNGDQPGGAGTITSSPVITLTVDNEPTGETEQGGTQDATDDDNGDMTIDFGFAPYVSLGSTVFYDLENDGQQGTNDAGIPDVTVELYDATGTLVMTDTTDSNGDYYFGELLPGDYQVVIPTAPGDAPVSSMPTDGADNQEDGDDNGEQPGGAGTATNSPMITLTADGEPVGESEQGGDQDVADDDNGDMTIDFGFFAPVGVGDIVWIDNDDDGEQDAGEPGVAGVKVNLYNSDGTPATDVKGDPVPILVTDGNGNYLFEDQPPGEYYVEFDLTTLPGAMWDVAKHDEDGVNDSDDSDADPDTGQSGTTDFLLSGEEDLTLDMGVVAPVKVGDRVWYDDNKDGIQDPDEAGVENVLVVLHDTATGQPILDQFDVPLVDITDNDGYYLFEDLPPSDYYVKFQLNTLPVGYVVTQPNATSDQQPATSDQLDSDADLSTGITAPTGFLPANTEDLTLDMGIYLPEEVRIGDRVWLDSNRDGIQDGNEAGVPGVTVTLVDGAGNSVTVDRSGDPIEPLVTDEDGYYFFKQLPPGDYGVIFDLNTLPPYHEVTSQDSGSDDLTDSDADPVTGETPSTGPLADLMEDLSLDLGIYPLGEVRVGDVVWYDDNHDGIQDADEDGVEDVTVTLFNDDGTSVTDMAGDPVEPTVTDDNGEYLFENLPAGEYYVVFDLDTLPVGYQPTLQDATSDQSDSDADPITGQTASTDMLSDGDEDLTLDMGIVAPVRVGDIVWYDNDKDGLQDDPADEPGVEDVTVKLFNEDGTAVTADMDGNPVVDQVTDADGNYLFENLLPGDYYVQFDLATLPTNYVPTTPNVGGNDGADSDADLATGETDSTDFLPSGSEDLTLDLGIVKLDGVRVGDTVWYDDNINGLQDAGEAGVSDVTVALFNADGTPVTDMDDNPVGNTTTDEQGNYLFDNLPEGDYYVEFDLGTLPADSIITLQDAGDDAADSDADPATGESATTGELANGEQDLTLDMGIYAHSPGSIELKKYVENDPELPAYDPADDTTLGQDAQTYETAAIIDYEGTATYRITVRNTGPTDLSNVVTTDDHCSGLTRIDDGDGDALDLLSPGERWVYECQITNVDHGVTNVASVEAIPSDPDGTPIPELEPVSDEDPAVTDPSRPFVDFFIDKDLIGNLKPGETAIWELGVTNLGPDPAWGPVTLVDDLPDGFAGVAGAGDGWTCSFSGPENRRMSCLREATLEVDMRYVVILETIITAENVEPGRNEAYILTGGLGNPIPEPENSGEGVNAGNLEDNLKSVDDPMDDLDNDGQPDNPGSWNPNMNDPDPTNNYAFYQIYPLASIGDKVWEDLDADGLQEPDEPPIEGVLVELFNADGTPPTDANDDPMTTTTDENGNYGFDELTPGEYYVKFTAPDGYRPSPQDATNDQSPATSDQSDSDADPITGQTAVTELTADEHDPTWDAGFYQPQAVRVGDRVWYDNDGDGMQDDPADEPGVEGVTVKAYNDDGTPATDIVGNPVGPEVTDTNGEYIFENLPEGGYYVEFMLSTLPERVFKKYYAAASLLSIVAIEAT